MSDPLRVRMSGPLSVFAAGFREELLEQGYRPGTTANQLQLMAHLSRWLAADDVEPAALSSAQIERFREGAPRVACTARVDSRAAAVARVSAGRWRGAVGGVARGADAGRGTA